MTGLVTGDTVCKAVEATLVELVPALLQVVPDASRLGLTAFDSWFQVPDRRSLSTAVLPAGAIMSPGLVEPPTRRGPGEYDATWRVAVSVWERGTDWNVTSAKVRTWAAIIRAAALLRPSQGGLAEGTWWVGEEYAEISEKTAARTLGCCAVALNVKVKNVIDLPPNPASGPLGVVTTVHPSVTAQPPNQE